MQYKPYVHDHDQGSQESSGIINNFLKTFHWYKSTGAGGRVAGGGTTATNLGRILQKLATIEQEAASSRARFL